MILEQIEVGDLQTNCFILGCEKKKVAAVIDPGGNAKWIIEKLRKLDLEPEYIIATHAHFDHIGAVAPLKREFDVPVYLHKDDWSHYERAARSAASWGIMVEQPEPPDKSPEEGDIIEIGSTVSLEVLHTPGHSPGGISLKFKNGVFVGDSLFFRSIGRTDFPGGSFDTLMKSIKSKLFVLPDDFIAYTGHGPNTKIGDEKKHNPFIE